MMLYALILLFTKTCSLALFARVNQNIVRSAREEMYKAVLRKDIGWHENNCASAVT